MKSPENLKNNFKDNFNGSSNSVSHSADSFISEGKKTVKDGIDSAIEMYKDEDIVRKAKDKASELASESLSLIKRHPYYAAIGASAVGIFIGYFLLRSKSDR